LEEHVLLPSSDGREPDEDDVWQVPAEQCNFRDDDFNGLTDEGFSWALSDWSPIASGYDWQELRAVRMPDGAVGFGVSRQNGPSSTDLWVGLLDADGSVISAPREVAVEQVLHGWDVAVNPVLAELAIAYVRQPPTEENCEKGCIFEMLRFDRALSPKTEAPEKTNFPRHRVRRLFDLDWNTAGYVSLTLDKDGYAWVEWIDHLHFVFPNGGYGKIPGMRPDLARMSVGPATAWTAMGLTDADRYEVWSGVFSPGGYQRIVEGHPMASSSSALALGKGNSVAWGPNGAMVLMAEGGGDSAGTLLLGAVATGETRVAGQASNPVAHSLTAVGSSLIASSSAGASTTLLWRWEDPPGDGSSTPFATLEGTLDHVVVAGGYPPLVLRVTADGKNLQVARVHCVEP
jgi:hypothetical protein